MTTISTADGSSTALNTTIVRRIPRFPTCRCELRQPRWLGNHRSSSRDTFAATRDGRARWAFRYRTSSRISWISSREANPDDPALGKRSSEIAQCAIDAYFEAPEALGCFVLARRGGSRDLRRQSDE